jgi:ketosteroid isomerase-like protein
MQTMKLLMLLFFVLASSGTIAQNLQKEINSQVWRVQLEAMNTADANGFISVMSDDVIQVSHSRKIIRNKDEFFKQAVSTYKRVVERKLSRKMEFRFLERIATTDMAFEDGFYKYELVNEQQEKQVHYGYFQVVLRKEKDKWKVLVDYSSDNYNGVAVKMEQFENARTLDSYEN